MWPPPMISDAATPPCAARPLQKLHVAIGDIGVANGGSVELLGHVVRPLAIAAILSHPIGRAIAALPTQQGNRRGPGPRALPLWPAQILCRKASGKLTVGRSFLISGARMLGESHPATVPNSSTAKRICFIAVSVVCRPVPSSGVVAQDGSDSTGWRCPYERLRCKTTRRQSIPSEDQIKVCSRKHDSIHDKPMPPERKAPIMS